MQDRACEEIIETAEGPSVCAPTGHRPAAAFQEASAYSIKVWIEKPYDDVLAATRRVLIDLRCPVICETDIHDLMQRDLGVEYRRYTTLGVARPEWIHQALELDRDIGLLLPLNLAVYEDRDGAVIEAVDPMAEFALAGDNLQGVAREAKQVLQDVIDRVAASFV
jgi:uncharacterized protein (DUF302 family)